MSQNMTHTITLKAVDGTSVVFQKIGQSAQAAAAQVTSAGQKATVALNQEAAATDRAAVSATKLGTASTGAAKGISTIHAAASGAAFATFLGFLSNAASAAAEDEAAFTRLETAVAATGQSYGTYANSLDKAIVGAQRLSFSDDAAADALATLTAQTQDADKAQQLLGVSMDLARGKHIDLGTAATIVGKVAQGNTAILQRYGIAIDASATSTEALAELQQRFNGQAEAFSNTQGGAIARVQENLDNLNESLGGALGPMQTWIALLPGVTAGMGLAGGAAGALAKALFGVAEAEVAVETAGAGGGIAAFAAAAAPALTALGAAALVAAPAIVAVAVAAHQAAEAQNTWNASMANRDDFLEKVAGLGIDKTVLDIAEAFRTWNTVTTVTVGDTTQGLEDLEGTLYSLDQASVQSLAHFTEAIGGVTPENIQAIAQEVARLGEVERIAAGEQLGLADAQRAAMTPLADYTAGQAGLQAGVLAAAAAMDAQTLAFTDVGRAAIEAARAAQIAAGTIAGVASGAGLGAGLSGAEFDVEETRRAGAELTRQHEEEARATDEAARAAEEYARALQDERDAALQDADTLIGSQDERLASTQKLADAQEQYAERVGGINSDLADQLSGLEESYGKTVAGIQEQRVEGEQAAADAMKQINQDRAEVTIKAEQDIADVAADRQKVMADADRASQEAARQFAEQQQQTVEAQAAVRDKLQETTAAATQKWHEAQQQDIEAQRQIRQELATGIAEVERAFHEATQQAQQDLQRLAQDHRIAMQGFQTDERRIREDLALVLNDPRATAEQKNAAELQASRQLEDLNRQRKAEDLSHERAKKDLQEKQQQAAEDAARKEADLRAQAADAQKQADEQRAAAQEQYTQTVSQANEQAQQQLASIAEQQQSAAEDYQRQQAEAHRQEAEQLAALDQKQQDIIAARTKSYQDLADKRRGVEEDLAKKEDDLNKQGAEAAANYNAAVNDAQQQAAEQRATAQKQYADSTKTDITELQRLRDEGLLTEDEYQTAYRELLKLQDEAQAKEDARLATAAKTVGLLQQAAKAADPLDGPPRPGNTAVKAPGAVKISADAASFDQTLTASQSAAQKFADTVYTTGLAADWTEFARVYGDATSVLDFFDKSTWTATLDADKGPFDQVGQDAHQQGLNFSNTTYTAELNGDGDQFGAALADADKAGIDFQNAAPYMATISAEEAEDFQHVLTTAANDIHAITTNKTYYAEISAHRTKLDQIVADIRDEFDGKAVATTYLDIVARVKEDTTSTDRRSGNARKLGGMAALGTLVGEAGSELAIRGGRMWEVGMGGPEFLDLASGTLIMPHGAAQARMRGMALGGMATDSAPQMPTDGGRALKTGSTINNYGTITLKVDNADVGNEIARQLAGRER